MSILTSQYFDVPAHEHGFGHYEYGAAPGRNVRRRFFQSGARWDEGFEQVLLGRRKTGGLGEWSFPGSGNGYAGGSDGDVMPRAFANGVDEGGREFVGGGEEGDEDWGEDMTVDA